MKKRVVLGEVKKAEDGTFYSDDWTVVYLASDVDEHMAAVGGSTQGLLSRIAELEIAAARYRKLRLLNPLQFRNLYERNIREGIPFDTLVDGLGN
jgi:hypothetical protein